MLHYHRNRCICEQLINVIEMVIQWFTVGIGVVMGVMTTFGLGKHVSTLSPSMVEQYRFVSRISLTFGLFVSGSPVLTYEY